jgi:hypothetical protein
MAKLSPLARAFWKTAREQAKAGTPAAGRAARTSCWPPEARVSAYCFHAY